MKRGWQLHVPPNRLARPMARVILGGLLTSTFLNLVVVPALYLRWGRERAPSENQKHREFV